MKILKWILIVVVAVGAVGFITYWIVDEDLPKGKKGATAEQLADKMLSAVNDSAWQEIAVVEWDFANQHHIVWNKDRHWAKVEWEDYKVYLKLDSKVGVAFAKDKRVEREELLNKLLEDAYSFWANDSFWLNPITKIKDAGTERRYVPQRDENREGLLVTYTSGGVTPGDSYLWVINKKTGMPEFVKMWVQIIPIGGTQFDCMNWHTTAGGAKLPQSYKSIFTVNIKDFESWNSMDAYPNPEEFEVLE